MAIRCKFPSSTFNIFSGNFGDFELSRPIRDPRSKEKCPPPLDPSCCDLRFGVDELAVDDDATGGGGGGASFGRFALCSSRTCRHLISVMLHVSGMRCTPHVKCTCLIS
jgi:hypothetical protein